MICPHEKRRREIADELGRMVLEAIEAIDFSGVLKETEAGYSILEAPLTTKQLLDAVDFNARIDRVVRVPLRVVESGLELLLDYLSTAITGGGLMTDICYEVVGFESGNILHIAVNGDVSEELML
jgi:hypothetical protein